MARTDKAAKAAKKTEAVPAGMPGSDDGKGLAATVALALTVCLAPALGVPSELVLQDTLKSAIVASGTLLALFLLAWQLRKPQSGPGRPLAWHGLMLLPLLLMVYALGSMHWSHAYLAGGEAIRWFIFSALLWTGMQVLSQGRAELLAQGIHWGAVMASLWTALQFWVDFKLFPQGPNPASTFVNRNFFAEFAVCTLPFSLWLVVNARGGAQIVLRAFLASFVWVAIMMTGTRSALLAMLMLLGVLPYILVRYRGQFQFSRWSSRQQALALGVVLCTVLGLGSVPSNNPNVLGENTGKNALQRSLLRTASMTQKEEYTERSFSVRYVMWKATARMLRANPIAGVGAGAWEVYIPLYQEDGAQLETDYYAHNEILQLLAEYGLAGALFLALLFGYLCSAAWRTWRASTPQAQAEAPLRALVLASLLALLIVSNAGFAWRMACTGALFALCLALLAASDLRLGWFTREPAEHTAPKPRWSPGIARAVMVLALAAGGLAGYITRQAMVCENKLVRAIQMALYISESGAPNAPQWQEKKHRILELAAEGIAINPHYRKLTAMIADELARWGDWKDATWIWESVVRSRPFVVVMLTNIARGYSHMDDAARANAYLKRAKALQPNAPSVRSFEVVLMARSGQEAQAAQAVRRYFQQGSYDFDMVNTGYLLGKRLKDWPLAIEALQRRNQGWPQFAVESWMTIADIQATELHDDGQALQAWREALRVAPEEQREQVRQNIPEPYRARL